MNQRDALKATQLADEGLAFSNSLREENRTYFDNLPSSYFSIAAAISLTWTKHAKLEAEYVEYAARFIDGKTAHDPEIARRFWLRFGPEELDDALTNYAIFYRAVRKKMPEGPRKQTWKFINYFKGKKQTANLINCPRA